MNQKTRLDVEPIALTIADAVTVSGLSRSAIYRELAAGNIQAVKQASKTLVLGASLRRFVENLPKAEFRRPSASQAHELTAA